MEQSKPDTIKIYFIKTHYDKDTYDLDFPFEYSLKGVEMIESFPENKVAQTEKR